MWMNATGRLAFAAAMAWAAAVALPARAEDRATVRGVYYREASTKVVQPMVLVTKDLPHGIEVGAHGLVDAITSPSILTGVAGDDIFTEYRKEAGVAVSKTIDRTRLSLRYRESREPDYISRSAGVQLQQGLWENTGTLVVSLAHSRDVIGPNLNKHLQLTFLGVAYTQVLSPVLVAEGGYELAYLEGDQCNPYDADALGTAMCPEKRLRHVWFAHLARYEPAFAAGGQLHYRFYFDHWPGAGTEPWGMQAHTVEARLYKELPHGLEVRAAYRYHTQGTAHFRWCAGNPALGPTPECQEVYPRYHATDEKLTALVTHVGELKVYWEARALARVPVLDWFADGEFELSYGRYFQETHYGDAHLLQTGYSLAF